jgi:transposase InsO family protein
MQIFLGFASPELTHLIERHRQGDDHQIHLKQLTRQAIAAGCLSIVPAHAKIIERLADAGFFQAGVAVARCTVERLMRHAGLRGVRRGKVVRTTIGDRAVPCPLDRVNRQFKADRPNQLWVSDFTYVSTWQGWQYVAFVIDVYARRIVGWRQSSSMRTDFVLDALEQALYDRQPQRDGALIHHSDRGSQYVSIRYSERLSEAGIEPSVGSKGDSYDNALAETINGLYKAELIHRRAPWKTKESLELATLEWVSWFNHHRLLEPIGYIPPAEAEENYYRQLARQTAIPV